MTSTLDFFRSNIEIAVYQGLLVSFKWTRKNGNQLEAEQIMWPRLLTKPMTLAFNFQGESLK